MILHAQIAKSIIILSDSMTPIERWQSVRKLHSGQPPFENSFVLTCLTVLLILLVLLTLLNKYSSRPTVVKEDNDMFSQIGKGRGLNKNEIHIMKLIAQKMPLTDPGLLFTMPDLFNKGAQKVEQDMISQGRKDEHDQLNTELSFLREKLGFVKRVPKNSLDVQQKDLSSRQIPVNSKVFLAQRMTKERKEDIEGVVFANNSTGLTVKIANELGDTDGDYWQVRYHFGSGIWEFDSSLVVSDGKMLIFSHSDDVRFVNRRRFLRVPVRMPALVAEFKFSNKRVGNPFNTGPVQNDISEQAVKDYSGEIWGSPDFYPAVITELGGPGLRLTVPMEVEKGQRLLVVFRLTEGQDEFEEQVLEIIQDVSEIKDVKEVEHGYSIAVELTNTEESNISRLIQITNKVSVDKEAEKMKDEPSSQETVEV